MLFFLCCVTLAVADFATEDLRRFQKASSNRPLRTLRPLRKQPPAPQPRRGNLDQEEFRVRPVRFRPNFFQNGQRVGVAQSSRLGPYGFSIGYLAHILRLLSYLVSVSKQVL